MRPLAPPPPALQTASAGWKVTGDVVALPLNAFNTAVTKRSADVVGFEAVAPLMRHAITTP